jgi:hypothetical protein
MTQQSFLHLGIKVRKSQTKSRRVKSLTSIEGWESAEESIDDDSCAPDVYLWTIPGRFLENSQWTWCRGSATNHFRSHVHRTPTVTSLSFLCTDQSTTSLLEPILTFSDFEFGIELRFRVGVLVPVWSLARSLVWARFGVSVIEFGALIVSLN